MTISMKWKRKIGSNEKKAMRLRSSLLDLAIEVSLDNGGKRDMNLLSLHLYRVHEILWKNWRKSVCKFLFV
jgi:hypothetical protein